MQNASSSPLACPVCGFVYCMCEPLTDPQEPTDEARYEGLLEILDELLIMLSKYESMILPEDRCSIDEARRFLASEREA